MTSKDISDGDHSGGPRTRSRTAGLEDPDQEESQQENIQERLLARLDAQEGELNGESPLWDKFSAISCKFNGPFAVSDLSEMAQRLSPFGPVLI